MTRQEIFDTVATHLITQGRRAYDGACMYRAPDGKRCAIGCLIPDDLYVPEMEGAGVDALYDRDASVDAVDAFLATLERLGIDEADGVAQDLLVRLQSTHDNSRNWPDIGDALRRVAANYGLEVRF